MSEEARLGDFRVICDRSGFKCWASETVIEWTGLRVLRRFADVRNPQDFLRAVPEEPPPTNTRPETTDVYAAVTLKTRDGLPILTRAGLPTTTEGG